MKIALAVAAEKQDTLFSTADLNELAALGELVRHGKGAVDANSLAELAADADVVIGSWGMPRLDATLLARLPELRLVIYAAGSVKGVVSPEMWERGIRVTGGNGPLGRGVAETALGLTIASLKNLWRLAADTAAGGWGAERARVRELFDVTVGVIGAGKAGAHYIELLSAFDVDVLVYDPLLSAEAAAALGARSCDIDSLLRAADVVSIHAPSIPETHHLLNAERLALLKDDAILINTARGTIIDEAALVAELQKGRLFACLDVTDPEPPAADHPLRSLPNCVITAHVAGAVNNGLRRLGRHSVAELRRFLDGSDLVGEIRASDLARIA
jgi:phosphoglycerate dehydrogenase-like enzyme